MKNIFITLDGVDGVGKTTVAKIISAEGLFQYYKSPSGPFAELRKEVDIHANPLERYCFYRLATHFDSQKIKELLKTTSVICDRYIISTIAYHKVMDPRINFIHDEIGLIKPDISFLLSASSEIRNKRITVRKETLSDILIELDNCLLDKVEHVMKEFEAVYIDTSDVTAEQVASIIKNELKRREFL